MKQAHVDSTANSSQKSYKLGFYPHFSCPIENKNFSESKIFGKL
jgi:hypothetical protein